MEHSNLAWQVHSFCAAPLLAPLLKAPLPTGYIRLNIRACALNFADLLMCQGKYQDTPEPPFTLGLECAGDIIEVAPDVSGFEIGQRVAIFSGQGGLAQQGCFAASRAVALPDTVDFDTAAALQIAYGTSHMALDYKARLQPGERLVVTGASGGVGLTAVEIGKKMGAEVIAIARGPEKLAIAQKAGADHLIDAQASDIRDQIKALGGADVVYDVVGGDLYEACFRATNPEGRILLIGFAGGDLPKIKPNHMLVKNISVMGFYWGSYLTFNPAPLHASLRQVFQWAADGEISPHISHRLPLEKAAEGLAILRGRHATGKVIIHP